MSEEVAVLAARFTALQERVEDRFEAWGRQMDDQNSALHALRQQLADVTKNLNKVALEMAKSSAEHKQLWAAHFGDKKALEAHIDDHREGRLEASQRGNVWLSGVLATLGGVVGAAVAWLLKP